MDKVFIKYIGGRAVWRDRIYHTGLVFEDGQVREVSAGAAAKLLRHGDVFAAVPGKRVEKADDTEALEKAGASELERETAAFDAVQDVILQINRMGKDELCMRRRITARVWISANRRRICAGTWFGWFVSSVSRNEFEGFDCAFPRACQ